MQNFIAQSMRRAGLAPKNKVTPKSITGNAARKVPESNAPLAHMEVEGKYAYSSLSYPLDLQTRTDLGHYMMFYVNVPNTTEYSTTNTMQKGTSREEARRGGNNQNKAQQAILDNEKGYSKNAGQGGHYDRKGRKWRAGEQESRRARERESRRVPEKREKQEK